MDAKTILEKVKVMFNELTGATPPTPPAPPVPPAATEYDLKDGGKVSIDKLEVGGTVMIDGNPALPGDLVLADGTMITVGDNGVISALTPAGAAAPPSDPPAFDAQGKFTELEKLANERFAKYDEKFTAQELQLAEYKTKLETQHTMIEQLLAFGKLMVEKPAADPDPAVRTNNTFKEEKQEIKVSPILFN